MTQVKLKVCCISSLEEAKLASAYGADYLGLVGPMPSGPGVLSLEEVSAITSQLNDTQHSIFLSSGRTAKEIYEVFSGLGARSIQVVRQIDIDELKKLRDLLPDTELFSVVHVVGEESIALAKEYQAYANYILLDSGKPGSKILGGTGKTHNWDFSRRIVQEVSIPVFLAGGLNPDNIKEAVDRVSPYGVDLCSGLRTNDRLDEKKLKHFLDQLRS